MTRFKASYGTAALVIAAGLLVALLAGLEVMTSNATPMAKVQRPWEPHLSTVEQTVADGNVTAALGAWHEAYLAARATRSWEGMLAVGDMYLRIGHVTASRRPAEATARELYLAALFRARHERSLDGVLRATEAFAHLGDREVARQALHIAVDLARGRGDAEQERVGEVARRLVSGLALAEDIPTF